MENSHKPAEQIVGMKVREIRFQRNLSLKQLAEESGLNINTLSLIENAKTSPSVGTLQTLSRALDVPIATFFEPEENTKQIVFTKSTQRPSVNMNSVVMQNLAESFLSKAMQPFMVTLGPGVGSGGPDINHTGSEFVYCLDGTIQYKVDQELYDLHTGDSLIFEAQIPHSWKNTSSSQAKILIVMSPQQRWDIPVSQHFVISENI